MAKTSPRRKARLYTNIRPDDGRMQLAKNIVLNAEGELLKVTSLSSACEYVDKFFVFKEGDFGIKKYVNLNGFSTPGYPKSLPNQGLMKVGLSIIKVLCDRAVQGDEEAVKLVGVLVQFIQQRPRLSVQQAKEAAKHLNSGLVEAESLAGT